MSRAYWDIDSPENQAKYAKKLDFWWNTLKRLRKTNAPKEQINEAIRICRWYQSRVFQDLLPDDMREEDLFEGVLLAQRQYSREHKLTKVYHFGRVRPTK